MRKMMFFLVLSFLFFWSHPLLGAPQINGKSALLMDAKSGQVLYEKEKDEQLPPASTTKILTAIMAIESGRLDEIVTVGTNPTLVEGTSVYLTDGEKVKLRDLVRAALLHSANDAALAIAEYLGGSVQDFAVMMNAKAKSLGAVNSNFVNPHGLSQEGHYSTAYDLALIGRYAMCNETFRQMVEAKILDWEGQAWQTRLININRILWSYEGANGVKTGYTKEARYTIVASAARDNRTYLAVVLGSPGNLIYQDAEALLDYGFKNFQELELASPQTIAAAVEVNRGQKLELVPKEDFSLSLPQESIMKVESRVILNNLPQEIAQGDMVGQMVFLVNGIEAGRIDLLAKNNISPVFSILNALLYLGSGLFFLQIVFRVYNRLRRRRRRSYGLGAGPYYNRSY